MKRESGYYWVKIKEWEGDEWVIAYYDEYWSYRGMDSRTDETVNPNEIDERRIIKQD